MINTLLRCPQILLLSGPVAVGKTSIAAAIVAAGNFKRVRSGGYLLNYAEKRGLSVERRSLQEVGDNLDLDTDYRWLVDDVAMPAVVAEPNQQRWLVDAVRKFRQVEHFRERFEASIFHLHLVAPEAVLEERYMRRLHEGSEYVGNTSYAAAIQHPNEIAARALESKADLVLDTTKTVTQEIVDLILSKFA